MLGAGGTNCEGAGVIGGEEGVAIGLAMTAACGLAMDREGAIEYELFVAVVGVAPQ